MGIIKSIKKKYKDKKEKDFDNYLQSLVDGKEEIAAVYVTISRRLKHLSSRILKRGNVTRAQKKLHYKYQWQLSILRLHIENRQKGMPDITSKAFQSHMEEMVNKMQSVESLD